MMAMFTTGNNQGQPVHRVPDDGLNATRTSPSSGARRHVDQPTDHNGTLTRLHAVGGK